MRKKESDAGASSTFRAWWKSQSRVSRICVGTIFVVCMVAIGFKLFGYRLIIAKNPSLKVPAFVCREKKPSEVVDGMLVSFSFPMDTPYFKKGAPFVKLAACRDGQYLETRGKQFYCDNQFVGMALETDVKGKPVESFTFNGIIPKGKVFVVGTHPRSYDSKYWGFLDLSFVDGRCWPLGDIR